MQDELITEDGALKPSQSPLTPESVLVPPRDVPKITSQSANQLVSASSGRGQELLTQAKKIEEGLLNAQKLAGQLREKEKAQATKTAEAKKVDRASVAQNDSIFMNPETGQEVVIASDLANKNYIEQQGLVHIGGALPQFEIEAQKTPEDKALDNARVEYEQARSKINNFKSEMADDAVLQNMLDNISANWDQRIKDAERTNTSRQAATTTVGIRRGLQFTGGLAGPFGSIISAEERAGQERIDGLMRQRDTAILEAKQAFESQEWERYVDQIELAEKDFLRAKEEVDKLNEITIEEGKTRREIQQNQEESVKRSRRDTIIADVINRTGVTDVSQLLDLINISEEGEIVSDISADEIENITKTIKVAENSAKGIVAEWLSAKESDPAFANMGLKEYAMWKDPTLGLDIQEQELRIKKLEKDLKSAGLDIDPLNALAFSQEYAATGRIPTGMPKGSFGFISEQAKQLPRLKGSIVNRITGVKSNSVGSVEQDDYKRLYNISTNINKLAELDKKRTGGVIGGILAKVFDRADTESYMLSRKTIVDDMQRMQSGAALTEEETVFYADYLPGKYTDTPGMSNLIGLDSQERIQQFSEFINNRLIERLSNSDLAIYGYSEVEINGKKYKVGDVVKNKKGQEGRVLPDNSISLIQ